MKKTIAILALLFAFMSIQAQTTKEFSLKVDSLQLKLDKLQHDYNCLHCQYLLKTLDTDLVIFYNQLFFDSKLLSSTSDKELRNRYRSYKRNYEVYVESYDLNKMNYKSTISLVTTIIENSNFHEFEIKSLQNIADGCEKKLDAIQNLLDALNDFLKEFEP